MEDSFEVIRITDEDKPIRIAPRDILRSILVAEADKTTVTEDDAAELNNELQQVLNPTLWSAVRETFRQEGPFGDSRLLLVSKAVDPDLLIDLYEKFDIPKDASLFVRNPEVSLDYGKTSQRVYAILVFREKTRRFIISDIEPMPADTNDATGHDLDRPQDSNEDALIQMLVKRVKEQHGAINSVLLVSEAPNPPQCALIAESGNIILALDEPPFGIVHRMGRIGWSHFLRLAGFTGIDIKEVTYPAIVHKGGQVIPCHWAEDGSIRFENTVAISATQARQLGLAPIQTGDGMVKQEKPWWKLW